MLCSIFSCFFILDQFYMASEHCFIFFLWWFNYLWILSYQLWSAACWGSSASFIVCLMLYCPMKTRLMKIEKQPKRSFGWTHMPLNYCTAYGKQAKQTHIFSSCTLWSIQVNYKPLQHYGMNNPDGESQLIKF